MTNLSALKLSAKSILVKDLSLENLDDFYEGLPYRYNSITDLIFQEKRIKDNLLKILQLEDRLFYKVFTLSRSNSSLPILECLEIDGYLGGMLSTYLHDFDRHVIEGEGNIYISSESMYIWQVLIHQFEFSFVFPAANNRYSRTSIYMHKIGFEERNIGDLRSFFNNLDNSKLFVDVMRELISSINNKSQLYSFRNDRFRDAKLQQSRIAKHWILTSIN